MMRPADLTAAWTARVPAAEPETPFVASRRRGRAAFHVAALWLRRGLAESARAWALAAGVPPDLYR